MGHPLAPLLRDRIRRTLRGRGWPRTMALRRLAAAALIVLAAFLAVAPAGASRDPTAPLLVAARDLPAGVILTSADLRLVHAPAALRPSGALADAGAAAGRMLAGATGSGEPITAVRLVGADNVRLTTGDADAATVPIRLADPAVADLVRPGARVDVVSVDERSKAALVLARGALVVTVHFAGPDARGPTGKGPLVLLAVPRDDATRIASVSLGRPVAVTLA